MSKSALFFRMSKVDEAQRLVYGIATAELPDRSREICDYDSTKPHFMKWSADVEKASGGKSLGNVREMHDTKAVGKLVSVVCNDDDKAIEVCAKIVDDQTWAKVQEGVLTGFSQGGEYLKRWKDPKDPTLTRFTASPNELSVVDMPCLSAASFEYIKADGSTEMRKLHAVEPDPKKIAKALAQVWKTTDGETFEKRADAITHQADLDAAALAKPGTDAADKINKSLGDDPGDETDAKDDAAKDKGDSSGEADKEPVKEPPADDKTSQKVAKAKFTKGLYDVARAADALQSLAYLQNCIECEAAMEEDESPQPDKLKAIMVSFGEFLTALCMEEVGELMAKRAADTLEEAEDLAPAQAAALSAFLTIPAIDEAMTKAWGGEPEVKAEQMPVLQLIKALEKAGARHSKADASRLDEMNDHVDDMGRHLAKLRKSHTDMSDTAKAMGDTTHAEHAGKVKSGLEKSVRALDKADATHGGMEKCMKGFSPAEKSASDPVANETMEKLTADNGALSKTVTSLSTTLEALQKRLTVIENEPANGGRKPVLARMEKGNELREPGSEAVDAPDVDTTGNGLSPEQARLRLGIRA